MEEGRGSFKILTGTSTSTGKRPLGRPWRRWQDNIRMDLKKIIINTRNWANILAQEGREWGVEKAPQ